MKKLLFSLIFFLGIVFNTLAQYGSGPEEQFGRTLNIGAGIGYYRYTGLPGAAIFLNYEFKIARNVTLAPFVGFSTYANRYYWGNPNYPYRYYYYRETSIAIGVKGVYYFDELLNAGSKWDFYAGASIGFQMNSVYWSDAYHGEDCNVSTPSPLFVAIHIGSKYHITQKAGIFLDLSNWASTFGVSLKL